MFTPNPGSHDAVAHGCTCPVLVNNCGIQYGDMGDGDWLCDPRCPIHSSAEWFDRVTISGREALDTTSGSGNGD